MYTEGFESLEEAEKESRNTYGGTNEADRLLRENEKLKKSLEKEKFFNKLLDQEIQEMKMSMNTGRQDFHSEYWSGSRGVSRGAFYLLLLVTLILGGYIGYGIYYNKPMNYLNIGKTSRPATVVQNTSVVPDAAATSAAQTSSEGNVPVDAATPADNTSKPAENVSRPAENKAATPPPVAKDSVPNIIGAKKTAEKPKANASTQRASVTPTADEEYNEDEVNRVINSDSAPVTSAPAKPAEEKRPVIARYKVTSKANFYNNPDENSMRGTFISGDANKVVEALEEKDGFIYVVYTNDLGFTSRGWLSKQDLTKE
ncbi:MAG: hypothetical protein JNK79_15185 [Chitinophagaceae bacterium]|nr:hypothetical protein [Chitinophagaceae bacterium]